MVGNIIVGLIILLAVVYSGRKFYKTLSGKSGCGCGCGDSKSEGESSCCCGSGGCSTTTTKSK